MKNILFHVCCAPCFIAPWTHLSEDNKISALWFNHNIHPFTEYKKRRETLIQFCESKNINIIIKDEYLLNDFLRDSSFREEKRCFECYYKRLKYTALVAKKGNFDFFSTSLLYSKFQKHDLIKSIGEQISFETKIPFFYIDLREFWKEGIQLSKEENMYRQQYCGCIYSEYERYGGQ